MVIYDLVWSLQYGSWTSCGTDRDFINKASVPY